MKYVNKHTRTLWARARLFVNKNARDLSARLIISKQNPLFLGSWARSSFESSRSIKLRGFCTIFDGRIKRRRGKSCQLRMFRFSFESILHCYKSQYVFVRTSTKRPIFRRIISRGTYINFDACSCLDLQKNTIHLAKDFCKRIRFFINNDFWYMIRIMYPVLTGMIRHFPVILRQK